MNLQCRIAILTALLFATMQSAFAGTEPNYDLRDITVGMPVGEIPEAGYANLTCAKDASHKLPAWSAWRECAAGAEEMHAIRFDFDPETSREGTMVAGHPVILTALIDDAGMVAGLKIDTDPKARLYMRKKAFLLGVQVKSRYGSEGWACTQQQPEIGEQPVGGVYLRETCTKAIRGRVLVVERDLFLRPTGDSVSSALLLNLKGICGHARGRLRCIGRRRRCGSR